MVVPLVMDPSVSAVRGRVAQQFNRLRTRSAGKKRRAPEFHLKQLIRAQSVDIAWDYSVKPSLRVLLPPCSSFSTSRALS